MESPPFSPPLQHPVVVYGGIKTLAAADLPSRPARHLWGWGTKSSPLLRTLRSITHNGEVGVGWGRLGEGQEDILNVR